MFALPLKWTLLQTNFKISVFFVVKPEEKKWKDYNRFFSLIKETILSADILRYEGNCLSNERKSV